MRPAVLGRRAFVLPLLLLALVGRSLALSLPERPSASFLHDGADIIDPAAEARINGRLEALHDSTGHTVLVATFPDLQGEEIEEFGIRLAEKWKPGAAGRDDGAILIVGMAERAARIEVGYGLEGQLTDALSRAIIERRLIPAFRAGRQAEGVEGSVAGIISVLGGHPEQIGTPKGRGGKPHLPGSLLFLIIVILLMVFRGRGRRGWGYSGRHGGWGGGLGGGFGGFGGGRSGGFGGWSGGSSGGGFGGGGASGRW